MAPRTEDSRRTTLLAGVAALALLVVVATALLVVAGPLTRAGEVVADLPGGATAAALVADAALRLPSGGTAIVDRVTAVRWCGRFRASEVGAWPHSTGSPLRGGTGYTGPPMRGHGHDLPGHRFAVARCCSGPSGSLSERHGFFSFVTLTRAAACAAVRLEFNASPGPRTAVARLRRDISAAPFAVARAPGLRKSAARFFLVGLAGSHP